MGITLFSYCGLIERLLHNEARQAAKRYVYHHLRDTGLGIDIVGIDGQWVFSG